GSVSYQPSRSLPLRHMSMSPPPPLLPPQGQAGFTQQATVGDVPSRVRSPLYSMHNGNGSDTALVRSAAGMPIAGGGASRASSGCREVSLERTSRHGSRGGSGGGSGGPGPGPSHGALGGGPRGYSGLAQSEEVDLATDPTQYDYFRSGRRTPGR